MIQTKQVAYTTTTIACDNCRYMLRNDDIRSCCEDDRVFFSPDDAKNAAKEEGWNITDNGIITCQQCLAKAKCAEAGEHDWSPWKSWESWSTPGQGGRGRHCQRDCGEYERIDNPPKPTLTLVGGTSC